MSIKWDSFSNIVDGKPRDAQNKHHGVNPATGEELWPVPIATQQDVDDAVESAQKAFEKYRYTPMEKRKELLQKFSDAWTQNAEEMINLLCKETGKPVRTHCYPKCPRSLADDFSVNLPPWRSIWSPPSSSTTFRSTSLRSALRTTRRS